MTCGNIAYIISHVNTEILDCFIGGLPALDNFSGFTCPKTIPHKLAFGETLCTHLCTPCTNHPCSNCSEVYQDAHFIASFPYMQAELVFSCTAKKWCLFQVLFLDIFQTCPTSHFMHRNATAVYMDFCHILPLRSLSCRMFSNMS
jgi:hypothetical protein